MFKNFHCSPSALLTSSSLNVGHQNGLNYFKLEKHQKKRKTILSLYFTKWEVAELIDAQLVNDVWLCWVQRGNRQWDVDETTVLLQGELLTPTMSCFFKRDVAKYVCNLRVNIMFVWARICTPRHHGLWVRWWCCLYKQFQQVALFVY